MIKLLVIADDFTGALDTGIQFKAKGTLVRVYTPQNQNIFAGLEQGVQVLLCGLRPMVNSSILFRPFLK